jgi:hypothetical protein
MSILMMEEDAWLLKSIWLRSKKENAIFEGFVENIIFPSNAKTSSFYRNSPTFLHSYEPIVFRNILLAFLVIKFNIK